ncbi:hypothetical protein CNR22_17670 [Sphingobacteriaceae bacterium]|nr:hypothetical protein CNR22_17670 [Sphingobacteriaceae bacterium]
MCEFQVITTNSFGCVVKCSHCEDIHLSFGNVLAVIDNSEFEQLKWVVENLYIKKYREIVDSGEKMYLNTDSEKFALALNAHELHELNTLLQEASVMLEVYTILDIK